ncbi:MAG: DUF4258 domain-containing protein [Bacteroidia bacterium]|nr:DUF4258 domain-containing protein [Bacteroidia bacterium]
MVPPSQHRKSKQAIVSLVVIGLILILYVVKCRNGNTVSDPDRREVAFRHNPVKITKHAQCRMDCRHIDEKEVEDILHKGKINYGKSDLKDQPCPTYAVEGITGDGQKVRIIVGNCNKEAVIITVMDLENEFECNCET